jgi:hypothetical protein
MKTREQSIEELKTICKQVGKAIGETIDKDNPQEIMGKLEELRGLLATSSHAVALAQMIYTEKFGELTASTKWVGLNATEKKSVVAGHCAKEGYYVDLTDRQNSSLTRAIDALRSMISYLKSEMANMPS